MRKFALIVAALLFCVVIAKDAFAMQTRGKVASVDIAGPTVVVTEDSGNTLTLAVTPKTDIQKGMKDLDISALAPGVIVIVRYKIEGGKNIAKYIGYESGELQRFGKSSKKEK